MGDIAHTMQVSHQFVKLSEQDSGKEHVFTWRDANGKFLCHIMYQSGADDLELGNRQTAPRGQVLRIQTHEVPADKLEEVLAPSNDANAGSIRLQVDGKGWSASDYKEVADAVLGNPSLSHEQQAAVMSQLASLYNLMATRYGQLFDRKLEDNTKEAMEQLVTDPNLRELSNWFAEHATAMLRGNKPDTAALPELDSPFSPAANPKLTFEHGIEPRSGNKIHTFAVKDKEGKPLIEAEYESGTLGETIIIEYKLEQGKSVAVPYNLMECDANNDALFKAADQAGYHKARDVIANEYNPVAASYQLEKLNYYRKMYDLTPEQQAATLLMLGSVTRLFATRFQREFFPIHMEDRTELQHYIRDSGISGVADDLLSAATKLRQGQNIDYPDYIGHPGFGTREAIKDIEPGAKSLDISLVPAADYWAMLGQGVGGLREVFKRYSVIHDYSVGNYAVPQSRRAHL